MIKRPSKKRQPTTLAVIVAIIIAVITALQNAQKTSAPAPTSVAALTPLPATGLPHPTAIVATTIGSTLQPAVTLKPLPTDLPDLAVTPINGLLYEVTGSAGALGCPDSRCKVINEYKKGSIIVVTGTVMGTTYKAKKTRIWYQVIFHDGSRVYIHGAYVKSHDVGATN